MHLQPKTLTSLSFLSSYSHCRDCDVSSISLLYIIVIANASTERFVAWHCPLATLR